MIGLVFALYLAHTLSGTEGEPCEPYFGFFAACLLQPLPCASTANQERRYCLHRTDGRIRNISGRCIRQKEGAFDRRRRQEQGGLLHHEFCEPSHSRPTGSGREQLQREQHDREQQRRHEQQQWQ